MSHPVKTRKLVPINEDLLRDDMGSSRKITHEWLWPTVGKFLRPKDVVVTETGLRSHDFVNNRYRELWYSGQQVPRKCYRHYAGFMGEVGSVNGFT